MSFSESLCSLPPQHEGLEYGTKESHTALEADLLVNKTDDSLVRYVIYWARAPHYGLTAGLRKPTGQRAQPSSRPFQRQRQVHGENARGQANPQAV